MMTQRNSLPLHDFLSMLVGSPEVGVVIAHDEKELMAYTLHLEQSGFCKVQGVHNLPLPAKAYIIADADMDKDVYDFVVQYPGGQVQLFDKKTMQPQFFSPDYKKVAVVLLVTKDNLNSLQSKGWNILAATGPAYQA